MCLLSDRYRSFSGHRRVYGLGYALGLCGGLQFLSPIPEDRKQQSDERKKDQETHQ